jgi:uncharacterized protein
MIPVLSQPLAAAAFYVALSMFGLLFLQARVIMMRRAKLVGIGDGNDRTLALRIRVHANYAENVPFALAGLIGMALLGLPVLLIHLCGVLLLAGRTAHAIGLQGSAGKSTGRVAGMVMTNVALIFAALAVLVKVLLP